MAKGQSLQDPFLNALRRERVPVSMRLRIVPELTFFYDNSLVEGMRMSNLVSSVVKHDNERRGEAADESKED